MRRSVKWYLGLKGLLSNRLKSYFVILTLAGKYCPAEGRVGAFYLWLWPGLTARVQHRLVVMVLMLQMIEPAESLFQSLASRSN